MPPKAPDYLTETHKIRKALWKKQVQYYVGLSIAFLIFAYACFDMNISPLFLTTTEQQLIKQYDNIYKKYMSIKDYENANLYEQEKRKIEKKQPSFITAYHVYLKWKQKDKLSRKIIFTTAFVLWYCLICFASHMIIKHQLNKMKTIIYQIPKKEEIMPLKNNKIITLTEMFKNNTIQNEIFTDPEKVERIINTAIVFHDIFNNIKPDFNKYTIDIKNHYEKYIQTFYPDLLQKKETLCIFNFLLWHYLINFYGNVPTGILSIYIKNEDFKLILSAYQRKILPVIYVKKRKSPYSEEYTINYIENRFFSYFFLRSLYEIDKMLNVFENIENKYSPLPFQSPVKFQ